ncbi:hypothetical protein PHYBLDRAFT_168063 [Phycomyces blakesleeanus NRRL 1555(-)]|uniref:Uncharacterized protein n=1 Tax=Phycomyces blakesleeanus (strain ATCC 8743b / DSM 1359 / FGSC 10004 / NBRC 33097 / NRRL 1555) TaxID=763407 RepID=A0A162PKB5_PHYB8|nr:hypothetical protein PHYBLDRAFT_168063 [Phycomyces blakesleeanus NRRL 1555(-)]OAD73627.1 hypothetical protein PHYBLDRAFT_168063 [Phycomyces blakesleeanus NRRL 1555(-)]|eukprot:XP_018291667.1 hypothetical protein PHYBLDRAFT_168063 [Phycomyces blakesleeanus NRRL 1555(-)]
MTISIFTPLNDVFECRTLKDYVLKDYSHRAHGQFYKYVNVRYIYEAYNSYYVFTHAKKTLTEKKIQDFKYTRSSEKDTDKKKEIYKKGYFTPSESSSNWEPTRIIGYYEGLVCKSEDDESMEDYEIFKKPIKIVHPSPEQKQLYNQHQEKDKTQTSPTQRVQQKLHPAPTLSKGLFKPILSSRSL